MLACSLITMNLEIICPEVEIDGSVYAAVSVGQKRNAKDYWHFHPAIGPLSTQD